LNLSLKEYTYCVALGPNSCVPYHHGMVHAQVADGGTASNMESSFEYHEKAVADGWWGVVLQLVFGRGANKFLP